jgi:hypothetical protein
MDDSYFIDEWRAGDFLNEEIVNCLPSLKCVGVSNCEVDYLKLDLECCICYVCIGIRWVSLNWIEVVGGNWR